MQAQKKQEEGLSRIQTGEQFNKLFQDQQNSNCFQCGKKSKQWAQTKHAIFLCLNCAAVYRDVMKIVSVKSIGLDLWQQEQIDTLKVGGNTKFKKFLQIYGLNELQPKIKLRSTAAQYYRRNLKAQIFAKQIGEPPSLQQGKKPFVAQIPITQMTSDQLLEEAKQRLTWVGQKTKQYGNKAYDKVHHKVTSGQLKEDVKNTASKVGQTVSTTAKSVWGFITKQIDDIKKPKTQAPKEATDL